MDGFDKEDGQVRIETQVQETGGTQTLEQIGVLNENIWGNVDLVKKKAKGAGTGVKEGKSHIPASTQTALRKSVSQRGLARLLNFFESPVFAQETRSLATLQREAINGVRKTVFILSTLQHMVFDLEKLSENSYAQKSGGVNTKTIAPLRQALTTTQQTIAKQRPVFDKTQKLTSEDFQRSAELNAQVIAPNGLLHGLFKSINQKLKSAYPKWDKAYAGLLKKADQAKAEGKNFDALMTKEERKFFRVFSRVQFYKGLLSKIYNP